MIVYNYDADLEVSDTCVRSSLLSWVELTVLPTRWRRKPAGIEITSLSPCLYQPQKMHRHRRLTNPLPGHPLAAAEKSFTVSYTTAYSETHANWRPILQSKSQSLSHKFPSSSTARSQESAIQRERMILGHRNDAAAVNVKRKFAGISRLTAERQC